MSKEKRYTPTDTYYFITRRTLLGTWWMDPNDAETERIFQYTLQRAQSHYNVSPFSMVVMANHTHLAIHDRDGNLSQFCRYLFSQTARSMNKHLDRTGTFWAPGGLSVVKCTTLESLTEMVAYTMLNPIGGHVTTPNAYEGCVTQYSMLGGPPVSVDRPGVFFSKRRPAQVQLEFGTPRELSAEDWRSAVRAVVEAKLPATLAKRPTKAPFVMNYVPEPMPPSFSPRYAGNSESINEAKAAHDAFDARARRRARVVSYIAHVLLPWEEVGLRHALRIGSERHKQRARREEQRQEAMAESRKWPFAWPRLRSKVTKSENGIQSSVRTPS